MNKFSYIKALWSPFKPFKLKFYAGKVRIGTPYFYPRRWVKDKDKPNYVRPVPKRVGFDFVGLGWKTKWTDTDYRFEYAPVISFVFFGLQLAVIIKAIHPDHYWESWLYYERNTDKTKSKKERVKDCRLQHPQLWQSFSSNKYQSIDYYDVILRKKYLKQ